MFGQEIVGVLLLVWVNASFRSVNVALSILSNWLRLLNVESVLLDFLLILLLSSVINCDVFVRVLFVHLSQMLLS